MMDDHDAGLGRLDFGAELVRVQAVRFRWPGLRSTRLGAGMVRRPSVEVIWVGCDGGRYTRSF